jgi:glucose-1-phosphate cytidylyltransferase
MGVDQGTWRKSKLMATTTIFPIQGAGTMVKVGILAGGMGTRLAEETEIRPKPMVEIGGIPILCHIMRHYSHYGFNEFAIALGYKGEYIKKYMTDYVSLAGNLTVDFLAGSIEPHDMHRRDWMVDLVDTGRNTMTGGRIKKLKPFIGDETCMITWGDGVADIDLQELLDFHRSHGKLATVTAVRPPARFGLLEMKGDRVVNFSEKPQLGEGWINGAFFVLEPGAFEYIDGDDSQWELEPMVGLARDGELMAYQHTGYWQCMDTMREKYILEKLWESGEAPWKVQETEDESNGNRSQRVHRVGTGTDATGRWTRSHRAGQLPVRDMHVRKHRAGHSIDSP